MKIKTDFITNSSSSSFVALGIYHSPEISENFLLKLWDSEVSRLEGVRDADLERWEKFEHNRGMYANLIALSTSQDKIDYLRDAIDSDGLGEWLDSFGFSNGGYDYDYLGIEISTLFRKFPELTFGNAKTFVAEKFNEVFETEFTEKDISYIEEATYDG